MPPPHCTNELGVRSSLIASMQIRQTKHNNMQVKQIYELQSNEVMQMMMNYEQLIPREVSLECKNFSYKFTRMCLSQLVWD
jgi:hypothetical protein